MNATLLEAWRATVHAQPAAVALIDATSGRRWTRADLDAAADAWHAAHGDAVASQTVAFAEPNGFDWLCVFLGLLKVSACAAPLDPAEPAAAQLAAARSIRATALWHGHRLEILAPPARPPRDGRRLVKFTSGSTGAPRALYFADAEMLADGAHICTGMDIRTGDLNLGLIPWGHSYGLGNLVVPLLSQGTAILFGAPPLPHAIAAIVAQHRPTLFPAVPALLRALAEADIAAASLASLRTVISAGAPLAPEIARAFTQKFARKIHGFYGSSETGGITYDRTGDSAALGRGVGTPLPGVTLSFARGNRFTVASDAVIRLRRRRPGSHRMPDRARLESTGELVLLGRTGRFVKIAGRRLNLAEVEHAICALPGVHGAHVAAHPGRPDALAAVVASVLPGAEIRDALRPRLAAWKIPRKWIVLPEFPLTSRGKPDTRRLAALLAGSSDSAEMSDEMP
ncbi:MAG TPA: fatty acid--CoA ligase family protein [Opitutus sp.]|nr:fatty acid--CoA ligase family protein [Opitutus sp.]